MRQEDGGGSVHIVRPSSVADPSSGICPRPLWGCQAVPLILAHQMEQKLAVPRHNNSHDKNTSAPQQTASLFFVAFFEQVSNG